jgi:hypothetical protein
VTSIMSKAFAALPVLAAVCMTAAAQEMPKTTKETLKGAAKVATEKMSGTVLQAAGNTLAVQMSTGEIKEFVVPADRKFMIDGKALTVDQLKPGTELHATITTTTTPVTLRTRTIGTGTVWFVSGKNVIITLPNGENRHYKVNDDYRFNIDGQKASVHDLRKDMKISAEKIVEEPTSQISRDTVVTGHAPGGAKPKTE